MTDIEHSIKNTLAAALQPEMLEVANESHRHNVPPGSESHFKITVVSKAFDGRSLIERHRMLNALLAEYLAGRVHAVALHTHTPEEWNARNQTARQSPPCLGGSRNERG